jgi:lipopolysaccharide/colanic/teichoic acid biosynthesis glycosyltransferase
MKTYKDTALFHSQIRVGRARRTAGGKIRPTAITITKFRVMKRNAHQNHEEHLTADDPFAANMHERRRGDYTHLGWALDKTHLNELPQIISVLKGDLAIVGPRPITRRGLSYLSKQMREIYLQVGLGLLGIEYALPKRERTTKNIEREMQAFYVLWRKSKVRAYRTYAKKILINGAKLKW